MTDPSHRPPRGQGAGPFARRVLDAEQQRAFDRVPGAHAYVALLRQRRRGNPRELRWLVRMTNEYPLEALAAALDDALRYGMTDLERLERMVLRRVGHDFFVLPCRGDDGDTGPENAQ